jgi:L-ascorbate metabolism protein UlaG (beta-lactamase superfamily)
MTLPAISRAFTTIVSISLFAMASATRALAQTSKPASSPSAWNDTSLIAIQEKGGDPARPGNVEIDFYGHDAFRITSPAGLTVLADPWQNDSTGQYPKWFLKTFPAVRVDIVLSTHAHFDHDAVGLPNGLIVLQRLVGQYKLGDIEITGLADKHQCAAAGNPSGPNATGAQSCPLGNGSGFDNIIQIIATGGLRIAIWGDNRAVPEPSLDHYLKDVDVLFLPVDNVLTRPEVEAVTQKYDPKAIIPAHYFIAGLNTDASGLDSADTWVNDQEKNHHGDVRWLTSAHLTLNPAELKGSHHRIYYFGKQFEVQ